MAVNLGLGVADGSGEGVGEGLGVRVAAGSSVAMGGEVGEAAGPTDKLAQAASHISPRPAMHPITMRGLPPKGIVLHRLSVR